jgi:centrosomal protein CEP41
METRYSDRMADKRTIAQKYGNKELMDKKLKPNPKYKNIGKVIDTGSTINNVAFISDQLVSKRKSELFKRLKGHTIIKLLKSTQENQIESIYNIGNEEMIQNNNNDNQSVYSQNTNKSNITGVTAVTYATEMLGNLSEIDYIILDLREESDYRNCHIKEALNFPGVMISRDKFLPEMIMMKNKEGKMIILYHTDERNGVPYANLLFQKGYDNVFFLSGGIEEFMKKYPEYLEGPEREKYINMKIEEDKKNMILEQKRAGKNAKYNIVGKGDNKSTVSGKSNVTGNSNIHALKKDLQKK